jgi:hypothetical protein
MLSAALLRDTMPALEDRPSTRATTGIDDLNSRNTASPVRDSSV